ncbi:hypothetical protein ACMFMF_007125 [Clarireedia jacksonii]
MKPSKALMPKVIHAASPLVLKAGNNERDLLLPLPAIRGTISFLQATQKYGPKVERIVINSSFAAVIDIDKGPRPGYTYSEAEWNPMTYEAASNQNTSVIVAYCTSIAFTEKAAWNFMEKN